MNELKKKINGSVLFNESPGGKSRIFLITDLNSTCSCGDLKMQGKPRRKTIQNKTKQKNVMLLL